MAGIGFELRKLLARDNLLALLRAYAYAGVISSGPWILSILGMLLIGVFSFNVVTPAARVTQFQVTITNLIAGSLILTGTVQLAFTRFVADRLFERKPEIIVGNYHALLLAVLVVAGLLVTPFALLSFPSESLIYAMLFVAGFVVLSAIWIATVFLAGIKQYRAIVALYFVGYGLTVLGAIALREHGLEGLLGGFVIGQLCLFCGMHALIVKNYPTPIGMSFEFFRRDQVHLSLVGVGFLYNLGTWIDKFIFWHWQPTSQPVIGPLRASVIYDLPVFMAYLSIIPGMAIFLVRIETDFVDHYDGFYGAVRGGGSLQVIERHRNGMVQTVRDGLFGIVKIQAITILLLFVSGERLLRFLGISDLYLPLLYVQTIAASLQVLFLSVLTVYFYLDKRVVVLGLCGLFVVLNTALTMVSIALGPAFYGYGFALALLATVVAGFVALERSFGRLEYSTFMLQ